MAGVQYKMLDKYTDKDIDDMRADMEQLRDQNNDLLNILEAMTKHIENRMNEIINTMNICIKTVNENTDGTWRHINE